MMESAFFKRNAGHWEAVIQNAKRNLEGLKFKKFLDKVFVLYPTNCVYEQMVINTYSENKFITIKKNTLYFMGNKFNIENVMNHHDKMIAVSIKLSRAEIQIIKDYDTALANELGGWFIRNEYGVPCFISLKQWKKLYNKLKLKLKDTQ